MKEVRQKTDLSNNLVTVTEIRSGQESGGDGSSVNQRNRVAQASVEGHRSEHFMFLFLQLDFGGVSWGHSSLIGLVVSCFDGRFGVSGNGGGQRVRVGENAALLAAFGGGGGGGSSFFVHSEELSAGGDNLL